MNRKLTIGLIIATVMGLFFSFPSAGSAGNVLIIANKSVPVFSLSKNEIDNIFVGKKTRWPNDAKIHFVIQKKTNAHKEFLQEFVHKTTSQYSRYWKKQVFTGKGRKPQSFKSEKSVVDYVARTEGAIGYISSTTVPEGVNVLKVTF